MKKTLLTLLTVLIALTATAQQQGINYKALIKDASGNVIVGQNIDVKFSIIEDTNSTVVYSEVHTNILTDANGIIILSIGEGSPIANTLADVAWFSDTHSLKTEIDIEQDTTFIDMGTTQFMAVPYAKHAKHANTATTATTATTASNVTGLEAIDEGNGIGWRLKGRNPNNYGNIGPNATDLSFSASPSTTRGATGESSTAMGFNTTASEFDSTAMGLVTTASGEQSTAMGFNTTASGNQSTAMGNSTQAKGISTTAMGFYNYDLAGQDRLLIVGNGTFSNRGNAFTVYQGTDADLTTFNSGYVMIGNNSTANLLFDTNEIMARNNGNAANLHLQGNGGNVFVNGAIVHTSDRRLKKDITALPYGLKEILKLNPVAYNWKNRPTQKHKSLGLIAQELQEVVSNVVYEDEDTQKTLNVNYTELIPILINAIKEQQAQIETLQTKNQSQDTVLAEVLKRLNLLEGTKQQRELSVRVIPRGTNGIVSRTILKR